MVFPKFQNGVTTVKVTKCWGHPL